MDTDKKIKNKKRRKNKEDCLLKILKNLKSS